MFVLDIPILCLLKNYDFGGRSFPPNDSNMQVGYHKQHTSGSLVIIDEFQYRNMITVLYTVYRVYTNYIMWLEIQMKYRNTEMLNLPAACLLSQRG